MMLRGLPMMQQVSVCYGLSVDAFSFHEDCLAASDLNLDRCEIIQAPGVLRVTTVGKKGAGLGVEAATMPPIEALRKRPCA